MVNTVLGVDIGSDSLKLALMRGYELIKSARVSIPENMIWEGRIASVEVLGSLIRDAIEQNDFHASKAAVTIPHELVYLGRTIMPDVSEAQIRYNISKKWSDQRTENNNYFFDYITIDREDKRSASQKEIIVAAAQRKTVEDIRLSLRKAGLELVKAAPAVCSYISLVRALEEGDGASYLEYCIVDLGHKDVRVHILEGGQPVAGYTLGRECSLCSGKTKVVYERMARELTRVIGDYRTEHSKNSVPDVWFCGGGAAISALRTVLTGRLDMRVHRADELLPGAAKNENVPYFIQAAGIAMDRPGREAR